MTAIQGRILDNPDKGRKVAYTPVHGERQIGIISSWNDSYVFVDYGAGAQATRPGDLTWRFTFLHWKSSVAK